MNSKNTDNKKEMIYLIIFVFTVIAIFIFFSEKRLAKIDKYPKYTIGTTTKSEYSLTQSSLFISYKFKVRDIYYENSSAYNVDSNIKIKGGHYVVKFYADNPRNSKLLLNLGEVPDSITQQLYFSICDTLPKW